ncbi:hypothetical protein Ga0100231_007530 [Opitutaceae bacterium TAV4]|nr:hypothetical protein Ga0100231_007530 [Opitutaceae bacterium TAV4]RRJ98327.1 hypothetical protein Ga0100230_007805 [Opitutaceae bacterium TAV3]
MKNHLFATFCLIALATFAPCLSAAVVIKDTFAITDTRLAGSTLSGSTTEIGNATWNATSIWKLAGDATNGYLYPDTSSTGGAAVPFRFSDHTALGSVATLSVTAALPSTTDAARYFSFGLGVHNQGSNPSGNANVWVRIYMATNTWQLRSRGNELASGTFDGSINLTGNNTFSFSYDESQKTVTDFSVNGTSLTGNHTITGTLSSVTYASLYSNFLNVASTKIDTFTVSVTSAIPEPRTCALLLGLGLLLTAGIRKLPVFRNRR